jgi:ankyrin repeat protein
VKCLALLLDRKADPDLSGSDGHTAAHLACMTGQVKCLQLLIARRANINARAVDGRTPLDLARMSGHSECVELLLENHAEGMRVEDIPTYSEAANVRPHF